MGSTRTLFHQTANVTISNSTNETTILGSGVGSLVFPVIGNGIFNYNNGLTGAGVIEIPSNATTIDSTVSNTFNVTAQIGTAAANNVLTSEVAWLLALDPP